MDLHPLLFDRHETLIHQPLIGHTGMRGQPPGHRLGAVSIQPGADAGAEIDTESAQLPNLGAAPTPLLLVALPHPRSYPAVEFRDGMVAFGDADK